MPQTIEKVNPPTLPDSASMGYSQITTTTADKLIFMSGQVAWQPDGTPAPDGFGAQAEIAIENVRKGLEAVGATPEHVTLMRVYAVNPTLEDWNDVFGPIIGFFGDIKPSVTGIGVAGLAGENLKVEIEVTAAL